MSNPWKTYRVRFSVREFYLIDLKARSADEALVKAEDLYYRNGEAPFSIDISEGGTDDWDAKEVLS